MMNAFRFKPLLKSVLWGGDKILSYTGLEATEDAAIGESWIISGVTGNETVVSEGDDAGLTVSDLILKYGANLVGNHIYDRYGSTFPLLVKIIDAHADLSIQVHPDDALAKTRHDSLGKTEMWYIIDAEPGAKIHSGLSKKIDRDEYYDIISQGKIMDVIAAHDSHPGDIFYIPAGRIHSIGAGNMLVEVQETSDVTYRVYDFDRRDKDGKFRELHTDLAADAIDYNIYQDYKKSYDKSVGGTVPLIKCPYFNVQRTVLSESASCQLPTAEDSFTIVFCVDGAMEVNGEKLKRGEMVLFPACQHSLVASGNGVLLTITA
ncbi:MAG: class I mannose-6-phosphate isomerase [Lachnospiraceae bacterium]|nr:class I mannose-6-phosphate isomerase [Lachnospiraceae bacterium]